MARMHARTSGKSGNRRPLSDGPPAWFDKKPAAIEDLVIRLNKDGHSKAEIGLILRDQHGVPRTAAVINKRITRILADADIVEELPEDLANLMRRAVRMHEHLGENHRDEHNKRNLALVEAKIRRLGKYYIRRHLLPADWRYNIKMAKLTVG